MPALEVPLKLVVLCVLLSSLLPSPAEAWYKQAAGPSYYSVGRASGLLSGIRRSPYSRRSEPNPGAESAENSVYSELGAQPRQTLLKNMVSTRGEGEGTQREGEGTQRGGEGTQREGEGTQRGGEGKGEQRELQ